jgi:hypothetical protein
MATRKSKEELLRRPIKHFGMRAVLIWASLVPQQQTLNAAVKVANITLAMLDNLKGFLAEEAPDMLSRQHPTFVRFILRLPHSWGHTGRISRLC